MPPVFFAFSFFFGDQDDSLRTRSFSTLQQHDKCSCLRFGSHFSTAGVVLSTFLTYWRAVIFYVTIIASIVSFSPRLNRLVASWMLPALLLFSSENFFPFRCRLFCILTHLFFQRFRWALNSGSDAVKLLLLCRDLTLSTFGVPLIALVGPIKY